MADRPLTLLTVWIISDLEEECYNHGGADYGYTIWNYINCSYTGHDPEEKFMPLLFLSRNQYRAGGYRCW